MAKNVVIKGLPTAIVGYRRREPIEAMKALGAIEVSTPREVAGAADAIILMVQTDRRVEEIVLSPNGLIEGMKKDDGILLMGT